MGNGRDLMVIRRLRNIMNASTKRTVVAAVAFKGK